MHVRERLFRTDAPGGDQLPLWAQYYADLGATIAASRDEASRLVLGIATPTRSYAAVLITLGIVCSRAFQLAASSNLARHFAELCALPIGTPLIERTGTRLLRGKYVGTKDFEGEPRVGMKVKDLTSYLPLAQCGRFQLSLVSSKDNAARRTNIRANEPFLRGLMPEIDPFLFVMRPRFDAIIVGHLSSMRQETQAAFVTKYKGQLRTGTLQDILGIRQLVPPGHGFRSSVQPVDARNPMPPESLAKTSVVVFDGSAAFLKLRHVFKSYDSVVLLDRTETRFAEGADQLNSAYGKRLSDDGFGAMQGAPEPPAGIEVVAYREARR